MQTLDSHTLAPTLVVGYGNPLRGDDGVGWQAAILLARELKEQVQVLVRHQLTPELAEPLSACARVIFIDAANDGGTPGQVCCRRVDCSCMRVQAFTHHVAPADLLVAAQELYGHAPMGYLITVSGSSFEYVESLSTEVEAALPKIVAQVRELSQSVGIDYGIAEVV